MTTQTFHFAGLTRLEQDAVEAAEWAEEHFGSLHSGGGITLRRLRRLTERGFLVSVGPTVMCDGDGCALEPERYREGFRLTDKGRRELAEIRRLHAHVYGDACQ